MIYFDKYQYLLFILTVFNSDFFLKNFNFAGIYYTSRMNINDR